MARCSRLIGVDLQSYRDAEVWEVPHLRVVSGEEPSVPVGPAPLPLGDHHPEAVDRLPVRKARRSDRSQKLIQVREVEGLTLIESFSPLHEVLWVVVEPAPGPLDSRVEDHGTALDHLVGQAEQLG